jgi:stearoyl-CoA desaturase (delta-9 desaturase)
LAHRALTLHPAAAHVFRFILWVTTGTRVRRWVAVHRKHHAFADREGDPHSPVIYVGDRRWEPATRAPAATEEQ